MITGACTRSNDMDNLLANQTPNTKIEYETVTVTLTTAGTLAEQLGDKINTTEKLIVSGPFNATDVTTLWTMEVLEAINMENVTIVESVATYGNGQTYSIAANTIGAKMFADMKLSEIVLPNSITRIGNSAFKGIKGYYNLDIVIPENVTSIGSYAFSNCQNLTSIQLPPLLTKISEFTFDNCTRLKSVSIGEEVTMIETAAFQNCTNLKNIELPANLNYIMSSAFQNAGITQIAIPNSVRLDSGSAGIFFGCRSLTSVQLPQSTTIIPLRIFSYCTSLTSIDIPSSVDFIEPEAFNGCSSLTEIMLPENITEIGSKCFANSGLVSIKWPSNLTSIPESAFEGCSSLTSISIPDEVIQIMDKAFKGTAFTHIDLPPQLRELGAEVFANCKNLRTITLPANLRAIGDDCFKYSAISTINLPESLGQIGNFCFSWCPYLQTIVIPENVNIVGEAIFRNSVNISSIFWNSSINVPTLFDGSSNPNCLLYIAKDDVEIEDASLTNIVRNGIAEKLTLYAEGGIFDVPQSFSAKEIVFTKKFERGTEPGGSGGWETISLPFSPTNITHTDGRVLAPFNAEVADAKPFWLRRLSSNGFENVTQIEAGIPYIIAMPNNEAYLPEYNVAGEVTFSAKDETGITIPVTTLQIKQDQGPKFALNCNFKGFPFYWINNENNELINYLNGCYILENDRFLKKDLGYLYVNLRPFTCYATTNESPSPSYYRIDNNMPATRSNRPLGPVPTIEDM